MAGCVCLGMSLWARPVAAGTERTLSLCHVGHIVPAIKYSTKMFSRWHTPHSGLRQKWMVCGCMLACLLKSLHALVCWPVAVAHSTSALDRVLWHVACWFALMCMLAPAPPASSGTGGL